MGRDSGKCLHQLDVCLWSTKHTSGGEQLQLQYPTEVCLHVEMQRVYTCYTTEITNHCYTAKITVFPVADPGFPVGGGVDLVRGAVDPRGGYVSKILHVKMKESGPVGGGARRARPPLDPPMVPWQETAALLCHSTMH